VINRAEDRPFIVPTDQDGVQRVEIVGGDYFFRPSHIVVKVNKPVEMKVRKQEVMVPHNIVINAPEAGIAVAESLGRTPKTIFFVPSKTGRFPMYCDKKLPLAKSHREKGMEGLLEVVE
jgi:plastocyanin domain-containing protein